MKRSAAIGALLTLVLVLMPAGAARADTGGVFSFSTVVPGGPGLRPLSETDLQVSISGAVGVDYHGAESAGCAGIGLCGVSGSTTWDPGNGGVLSVVRYLQHGKRRLLATLTTGTGGSPRTAADVTRQTGAGASAVCGDAQSSAGNYADSTSHSLAAISLRLVDSTITDFMVTRCAGPLASDLIKLLPVRPVARAILDGKSSKVIDLSTTRPFSAGGFAGTLRSTVVLRVGPKVPVDREFADFADEVTKEIERQRRRFRVLDARYKVTGVNGRLSEVFRGAADSDLCAGFDSCGTSGTLDLAPSASEGDFEVQAYTPFRRPESDVRAPFGLARRGRLRGVRIVGSGYWRSTSGTLASIVSHADGGAVCNDVVPIHHGVLYATVSGNRLLLSYYVGAGYGDPDHTRCPGPLLGDLPLLRADAQGSAPLSVLKKKRITLHLTRAAAPFTAPGYTGSTQQDITVTLERTKVREGTAKLLL